MSEIKKARALTEAEKEEIKGQDIPVGKKPDEGDDVTGQSAEFGILPDSPDMVQCYHCSGANQVDLLGGQNFVCVWCGEFNRRDWMY